jgi:hypothetical protein
MQRMRQEPKVKRIGDETKVRNDDAEMERTESAKSSRIEIGLAVSVKEDSRLR